MLGEPISFLGMYDGGQDYIYNLLTTEISHEKEQTIKKYILDLSGCDAYIQKEIQVVKESLKIAEGMTFSFTEAYDHLSKELAKNKIVFIILVDETAKVSENIFQLISKLRNAFTWDFSYVIFGYTNLFQAKSLQEPAISKIIKRNIYPVLPLDEDNAKAVTIINEQRYKKPITAKVREKIIHLAGGNPGLLKSLYLQAVNFSDMDKSQLRDNDLQFRLNKICEVLSKKELNFLRRVEKSQDKGNEIFLFLKQFGYLNEQDEVFSPLLRDYLATYVVQKNPETIKRMYLTETQRAVFNYLQKEKEKIVSREELASVIWRDKWSEKYSDWAIDQLIHDLRDKLKQLKLGKVITKKGEGFIFMEEEDYS